MSEQKKKVMPRGFNDYEDIKKAVEQADEKWDWVAKSDKYSTGLPILDKYLGGGFGVRGAGEVILIHSTSKTFKSTFSMQLMRTQLENGVKVGWIILEGGLWRALRNLKQLYAPVSENGKTAGYERYDELKKKLPDLIYAMTEEMQSSDFAMKDVVAWMKQARIKHGIELFLIDPIGYLSDYSSDWNIPDYKKESKFMKDIVQFADASGSTVICLQHNTKGNENSLNPSHREAAIGGSQSFSKSPTKVIEMRNEGWLNDDVTSGKLLTLEMYMARDVRDWKRQPVILEMNFHPDGKGKFFSMHKWDEEDAANVLKKGDEKDRRKIWYGQLKGENDNDLEELVKGL